MGDNITISPVQSLHNLGSSASKGGSRMHVHSPDGDFSYAFATQHDVDEAQFEYNHSKGGRIDVDVPGVNYPGNYFLALKSVTPGTIRAKMWLESLPEEQLLEKEDNSKTISLMLWSVVIIALIFAFVSKKK